MLANVVIIEVVLGLDVDMPRDGDLVGPRLCLERCQAFSRHHLPICDREWVDCLGYFRPSVFRLG